MTRPIFQRRRGNYSVMVSLLVPVVFGFTALSVDLSFMVMAETQAQFAADAASHAAYVKFRVQQDETIGNAAAVRLLAENTIAGGAAELEDIEYGQWIGNSFSTGGDNVNSVRLRVARDGENEIPFFFARMLGYADFDVDAWSTVSGRKREIMIAQDVTGSFEDDIEFAETADIAFLDFMIEDNFPGDKIGLVEWQRLVPFIRTELTDIETGGAGIRADWLGLGEQHGHDWPWPFQIAWCEYQGVDARCDDCPDDPTATVPSDNLCDVYNILEGGWRWKYCSGGGNRARCYENDGNTRERCNGVDWDGNPYRLQDSMEWYGAGYGDCYSGFRNTSGLGTRPGIGLESAIDHLLDVGEDDAFKVIVLLSDGLPNNDPEDYDEAEEEAERAWENDIHIWTVTYENGGGDFSWMTTLAKGLGTGYLAPSPEELDEIMVEIAASIPVVTVQ